MFRKIHKIVNEINRIFTKKETRNAQKPTTYDGLHIYVIFELSLQRLAKFNNPNFLPVYLKILLFSLYRTVLFKGSELRTHSFQGLSIKRVACWILYLSYLRTIMPQRKWRKLSQLNCFHNIYQIRVLWVTL